VNKVLDVLFVDLDQFPAGAMQQADNSAFCKRIDVPCPTVSDGRRLDSTWKTRGELRIK
jgi:hypothetical protein